MKYDGRFATAGFYILSPAQFATMRDEIVSDTDVFDAVLARLKSIDRALEELESLRLMSSGFADRVNLRPAAHLRRKSFLIREDLHKELCLSGDVIDRVEVLTRDGMPLLELPHSAGEILRATIAATRRHWL